MKQRKLLAALILGMATIPASAAEGTGEWVMGPAFKPGWDPHFTIAATAGYLDPDIQGVDGGSAYGLQLSLNCPWFSPPTGAIRQQFNYNTFDNDGQEITSLEMNPRYFVSASPSILIGAGPGIGYVWTKSDLGKDKNVWALQLGADIEYRHEQLFLALGTRYMWTQNKELGIDNKGANNLLTQVKVGFNF